MKPARARHPLTRRALLAAPWLAGASVRAAGSPQAARRGAGTRQQPITLTLPGRARPVRAWLALPPGYESDPARRWPLLVFLHGSGERGDDLERVKFHGPPKHAAAGRDFPCILVSPQLEAGAAWDPAMLHALLAALHAGWRTDPARSTATGLSLGGHGVWNWAAAYPEDLAAIAPVCGFGDPARVCRARQVPVRAYHGALDDIVPLARQQACVDALRACGGTVEFIVYPGVNHGAWEPAYEDPALLPWLMAQRRP